MTTAELLCGVDVGTSAVRAAVFRPDGSRLCAAVRPRIQDGVGVFDPVELWTDFTDVVSEVLGQINPGALRALAIAGHVGTILTDDRLRPVGPGYGWSEHHGQHALAGAWGSDLTAALRRVGRPVVTDGSLAILCWLARHRTDVLARTRWLLTPKDFLLATLIGEPVTDRTSAAYTLALDVRRREWAIDLVESAGVDPALLPPLAAGADVVGVVRIDTTALPAGLPVVAGGPDGTTGSAAIATVHDGTVLDIAGTTDTLIQILPAAPAADDRHAVLNPYLLDGRWSWGGPTGLTGGALAHLCHLIGLGDVATATERLSADLQAVPAGCDGLRFFGALTGSRFPRWHPEESGGLAGLTTAHTPAHLVRAAQEAGAYQVREAVETLAVAVDQPVVLAGGTVRSAGLAQLRADVLGRPVLLCREPDVTLLGAAALAAAGAGLHTSLAAAAAAMSPPLTRLEPDPGLARRYDAVYADWLARRDQR